MTIVGFLQNRNNVANGYLRRCLYSLSLVSDQIVVYDDASDEEVRSLYQQYECVVIYSPRQAFKRELYNKQQLLQVAMRYCPEWICWIDTDTVLGRFFEDRSRVENMLLRATEDQLPRIHLHNLNLWLSPWWYRVDNQYNDLWHGVWWYNTGELHYRPIGQLHQKQYPHSFFDPNRNALALQLQPHFNEDTAQLIHFGFSEPAEIAKKYFVYRENGQSGWPLTRLVDEIQRELRQASVEWYPEWLLSELGQVGMEPKKQFTLEEMQAYDNFPAWTTAILG